MHVTKKIEELSKHIINNGRIPNWDMAKEYHIHVNSTGNTHILNHDRMDFGAKWYHFFHSSGLYLATYARRQVISCVTKASACHHIIHANHRHCLWKIPLIIAIQSNVTTFIKVLRFVVNMFYCGWVTFTVFKQADIKGVRQRLTSTASLDDGYCEATIPVVKGHHLT